MYDRIVAPELVINSVGLLLDIAGVVLLFFFGLPSRIKHPDDLQLMGWGTHVQGLHGASVRAKWDWHQRMSRLGLLFLIVGFALQIASNHAGLRTPIILPAIPCP